MKRLLKISFNAAIFSFVPVLSWFILGLLVDKNLVNVFTLTYPIQFIWSLMISIFGVGPNICKEKEKNDNVVMSGIVLGTISGFIVFGLLAFHVDSYIQFMNMDVTIYHNFGLYSIIQLYIQMIFGLLLQKLYYEDKDTKANIYTISFNLLNFIVLVLCSLFFKNQLYIIVVTLSTILIYVIIMFIVERNKFHWDLKLFSWIKYDSVDICSSILFFVIYVFGLSNAASFGEEYMLALNFVALLTDTQWDAFESISTVAKIDISRGQFCYVEHRNNAYKLLCIIMTTVLFLFLIMFPFYQLDIKLVGMYMSIEFANFMIYSIYRIKTCFLQLEYSTYKVTTNKFIASTGRTLLSFLKTPFCTSIGQGVSSIYQFVTIHFIFRKYYKINSDGYIEKVAISDF